MKIIVNGEERSLSKACYLAEALQEWGYTNDTPIAVAVDNTFVPKQNYATLMLSANNSLEILVPMQGG